MNGLKESDLAARVVSWLEDQHWDVYQEVETRNREGIADIVAVQGRLLWVIECKLSFGLTVISQAYRWQNRANLVSVAVPHAKRSYDDSKFSQVVLRQFGIGHLSVTDHAVYEAIIPKLNRKASTKTIRNALKPEHKTYAKAGNASGHRWTPFQSTCREVVRAVGMTPGICMKDLVDSISTHYQSTSTARNCLTMWIDKGIIPGVIGKREGGRFKVYPSELAN